MFFRAVRLLLDEDEPRNPVFRREVGAVPTVFAQARSNVISDSHVGQAPSVAEDVDLVSHSSAWAKRAPFT
jgi:hypothetical protein